MPLIEKHNISQFELLLKVLSEEISEKDPSFQRWMEDDIENKKLYFNLKGKKRIKNLPFDKHQAFNNISDILGFSRQKKVFYHENWFRYAASVLLVILTSLAGFFVSMENDNNNSAELAEIKKITIDTSSKKAHIYSSQGEELDLSRAFVIKKSNGTIISNKNDIIRVQQNKFAKNKEKELLTIYVPKGDKYTLLLDDNSKVHLNSESMLTFPSHFDGDTRQVELTGEAYFEVKKDSRQFIVQTAKTQIRVLGTAFNVNAYQDEESENTTLVEGSVQIITTGNEETHILTPGSNFNINKSSDKISIREVDTGVYTAWINDEFIFRNQPLNKIFTQLARWYDFDIEYKNPAIQSMRFTGSTMKAHPLDYFLNQIQTVTNIKYKIEGEKVILY